MSRTSRRSFIAGSSLFIVAAGSAETAEECIERQKREDREKKARVRAHAETLRKIVEEARRTFRSQAWAPQYRWTISGRQEVFACNEYVAYVLRQAGAASWNPISRGSLHPGFRDPLANEWADPDFHIPLWAVVYAPEWESSSKLTGEEILSRRQPGDVIAAKGAQHGHVGIMGDQSHPNACIYSASSETSKVECNRWSMRRPEGVHRPGEYEAELLRIVKPYTVRRFFYRAPIGFRFVC